MWVSTKTGNFIGRQTIRMIQLRSHYGRATGNLPLFRPKRYVQLPFISPASRTRNLIMYNHKNTLACELSPLMGLNLVLLLACALGVVVPFSFLFSSREREREIEKERERKREKEGERERGERDGGWERGSEE